MGGPVHGGGGLGAACGQLGSASGCGWGLLVDFCSLCLVFGGFSVVFGDCILALGCV